MNMTDAEIKELAIKHRFNFLNSGNVATCSITATLAFAKELEAITREKVLAEFSADRESRCMFVARLENMQANGHTWLTIVGLMALMNDCDMLAQRSSVNLLEAMPPVPEGMQLVPTEPTNEMQAAAEKVGSWAYTEAVWQIDPYSAYKAMLSAAPKKG